MNLTAQLLMVSVLGEPMMADLMIWLPPPFAPARSVRKSFVVLVPVSPVRHTLSAKVKPLTPFALTVPDSAYRRPAAPQDPPGSMADAAVGNSVMAVPLSVVLIPLDSELRMSEVPPLMKPPALS